VGSRRGKGEGSIYQRDDGVWIGAIDLGWNGGKRSRKVVSAPTRGEVVKLLRDLQPSIAQGIIPAPERLTVAEYLNCWITDRIPGTITTRTEELYARAVRDYINPSVGKIRLNRLAPSDVSGMLQDLEARGYSPATKRMAR
jgi:integrase